MSKTDFHVPEGYPENYKSVEKTTTAFLRDRGSKFYAYCIPVANKAAVEAALADLAKEHPKARHICYAYRLGLFPIKERANDDGEPQGTAGVPILMHMQGAGITFCLIAVVRYFGGTLLGKGGLVNAYGGCAKEALTKQKILTFPTKVAASLQFGFEAYNTFMEVFSQTKYNEQVQLKDQDFDNICKISLEVNLAVMHAFLGEIQQKIALIDLKHEI